MAVEDPLVLVRHLEALISSADYEELLQVLRLLPLMMSLLVPLMMSLLVLLVLRVLRVLDAPAASC